MSVNRAPRVAVIGAGIAGLACARSLHASGLACTVFEKSRGAGGRTATRRLDGATFDHGAPFIGPPEPGQDVPLEAWLASGLVAAWRPAGAVADRLVAVPRMSALAGSLTDGLEVRTGVRIVAIERHEHGWWLTHEGSGGCGGFDAVVAAVPAPQAVPLLAAAPELAERAATVRFAPCWAAMFAFDRPLAAPFDVAEAAGDELALLVRDSAKPGRPPGERWVAQATTSWSAVHLEDDGATAAARLLDALRAGLGVPVPEPTFVTAHRWRYAEPATTVGAPFLLAPQIGLGACGDWCAGGRIAGAWTSGSALATAVVAGLAGR